MASWGKQSKIQLTNMTYPHRPTQGVTLVGTHYVNKQGIRSASWESRGFFKEQGFFPVPSSLSSPVSFARVFFFSQVHSIFFLKGQFPFDYQTISWEAELDKLSDFSALIHKVEMAVFSLHHLTQRTWFPAPKWTFDSFFPLSKQTCFLLDCRWTYWQQNERSLWNKSMVLLFAAR